MKKEIKKETDYTIDPQLQDAIERNYRRSFGESFKAREDRLRRERRKERILTTFIIIFILTVTCLLLISNSRMTNKAIDKCIMNDHSESYCYDKLA